jgi:ribosome-associated protein
MAKDLAIRAAESLENGKAMDVRVLHVEGLTLLADYFVIGSGATTRHVKALTDRVLYSVQDIRTPNHIEGENAGFWVLLDYGDVIVHVFREEERAFYGLERLWGDAPQINDPVVSEE